MPVLLATPRPLPADWQAEFEAIFAGEGLETWPTGGDLGRFDSLILGGPMPGLLARLPHLRFISSIGMGVDHITGAADLPPGAVIARVVDPAMVDQMAEYVTLAALRVERDSDRFDALQRERRWDRRFHDRPGGRLAVGLLGLGAIGQECARRLDLLGFPVLGWSRTPRTVAGAKTFAGAAGLAAMLPQCHILVCLLPLTAATRNLLDAALFGQLPRGAHVVNIGRGDHVVDADLLAALDSGQVGGATLDVFRTEPLPPEHPYWGHPRVRVTPHSAGLSYPRTSAERILTNLKKVRAGLDPQDRVEPARGY